MSSAREIYFTFSIVDYTTWLLTRFDKSTLEYAQDLLSPFTEEKITEPVRDIVIDFLMECYPIFDWEWVDNTSEIQLNFIEDLCRVVVTFEPNFT